MTLWPSVLAMTHRPTPALPDYLTYAEAAELLRVSVRTVSRYVADGRIDAVTLPTGRPRLRRADVESLLSVGAA